MDRSAATCPQGGEAINPILLHFSNGLAQPMPLAGLYSSLHAQRYWLARGFIFVDEVVEFFPFTELHPLRQLFFRFYHVPH
jgi:hypothetical protein